MTERVEAAPVPIVLTVKLFFCPATGTTTVVYYKYKNMQEENKLKLDKTKIVALKVHT